MIASSFDGQEVASCVTTDCVVQGLQNPPIIFVPTWHEDFRTFPKAELPPKPRLGLISLWLILTEPFGSPDLPLLLLPNMIIYEYS